MLCTLNMHLNVEHLNTDSNAAVNLHSYLIQIMKAILFKNETLKIYSNAFIMCNKNTCVCMMMGWTSVKRNLIDKMTKVRWCTWYQGGHMHGWYAVTGNNDRYNTDGVPAVCTDICYDIHGFYTGKNGR